MISISKRTSFIEVQLYGTAVDAEDDIIPVNFVFPRNFSYVFPHARKDFVYQMLRAER